MEYRDIHAPPEDLGTARRRRALGAELAADPVLRVDHEMVLGGLPDPLEEAGHRDQAPALAMFASVFWAARAIGSLSAPIAGL